MIHTDQGSNFESLLFKEMCKVLNAEKTRTTAYRPQSDGLVERANRTIQNMLASYVNDNQTNWDEYISLVTMAYNSSVQTSTGFSPSQMMYGREMTLPLDLVLGKPVSTEIENDTCYANELTDKMEEIHNLARKNLELSSGVQKRAYDHKIKQNTYCVGDAVWFYEPKSKRGNKNKKLARPWTGPFIIIRKLNDVIYKIQKNAKSKAKIVHHDRLKAYLGGNKPTWFKV